ncbi:MAG: Holliday junction resolvase RuvX [Patescibacteria group bacterium]
MKSLGIDYGTKRIGVAVSDDTGSIAFPLTTVLAGPAALEEVDNIARVNNVELIVIGESLNFKNEPNWVMKDIEQFKADIAELTGLPVEYQREFMTSVEAARQFAPDASPVGTGLRPRGSRKKNPSQEKLDAAAAALILQGYLDRKK